MVHVVQRLHVDAQGLGDALHVQTEGLEQLYEVHFLSCERIVESRAGMVALRPRAPFQASVGAPAAVRFLLGAQDRPRRPLVRVVEVV